MKTHAQKLAVMHAVWLAAYDNAPIDVLMERAASLLRVEKRALLDGLDDDWTDRVFCSRPVDWKPEDSLAVMTEMRRDEAAEGPFFRVGIDLPLIGARLSTAALVQKRDVAAAVDLIQTLGMTPHVDELPAGTRLFNAAFNDGTKLSMVPARFIGGLANFTTAQQARIQEVFDGKRESADAKRGHLSVKVSAVVIPSATGVFRLYAGGRYVASLRSDHAEEDLQKFREFITPDAVMAAKNEVRGDARRRLADDPSVIAEYSKYPESERLEILTGQLAGELLFARMKSARLVQAT